MDAESIQHCHFLKLYLFKYNSNEFIMPKCPGSVKTLWKRVKIPKSPWIIKK